MKPRSATRALSTTAVSLSLIQSICMSADLFFWALLFFSLFGPICIFSYPPTTPSFFRSTGTLPMGRFVTEFQPTVDVDITYLLHTG